VALLYDDGNSGADFTNLPDVNNRKGNGTIKGRFELSPYLHSYHIPNFEN